MKILASGTVLQGVWHRHVYRVIRELGRGAIGIVYLVENVKATKICAMKVTTTYQPIAAEFSKLEKIQKQVQSKYFGPLLFEMDDIEVGAERYHYYTMEYIDGLPLHKAWNRKYTQQSLAHMCSLVRNLSVLHNQKVVFSDIKPENILIESNSQRVRFIDFGGVVPFNRMIKQYSVLYDRGSWKMGNRKADVQYDLFGAGILLLQIFVKQDILAKAQKNPLPIYALYDIIHKELPPKLRHICIKVFSEKYSSANEMAKDLEQVIPQLQEKRANASTKRAWSLIDGAFWGSFAFMVGSIVFVWQAMFK